MHLLRHLLIFLIFHLTSPILCQKTSGFYVNNGFNQTEVREVLSLQQKHKLEEEMMDLLDISEKPKTVRRNLVDKSAPVFLMGVYKMMSNKSQDTPTLQNFDDTNLDPQNFDDTNLGLSNARGQNLQTIEDSNFIISLSAKNHRLADPMKSQRVKRLWFNVSHISTTDEILHAELRLFRRLENDLSGRHHAPIKISVYRVASGRNRDGSRKFVPVDSIDLAVKNEWVILNITESVQYWVHNFSEPNRGLYLSADIPHRPFDSIPLENLGIVGFGDDNAKQPFMVGYLKRSDEKRRKRSIQLSDVDISDSFFEELRYTKEPTICKRQSFYVNFADLNWQDIIIAPKGYEAYFCYGKCDFPEAHHLISTNHAIIQSLVHLRDTSIPKPCCAPTIMKKMKMVYQLDEDVFAYRDKSNMVVDSCGCL